MSWLFHRYSFKCNLALSSLWRWKQTWPIFFLLCLCVPHEHFVSFMEICYATLAQRNYQSYQWIGVYSLISLWRNFFLEHTVSRLFQIRHLSHEFQLHSFKLLILVKEFLLVLIWPYLLLQVCSRQFEVICQEADSILFCSRCIAKQANHWRLSLLSATPPDPTSLTSKPFRQAFQGFSGPFNLCIFQSRVKLGLSILQFLNFSLFLIWPLLVARLLRTFKICLGV